MAFLVVPLASGTHKIEGLIRPKPAFLRTSFGSVPPIRFEQPCLTSACKDNSFYKPETLSAEPVSAVEFLRAVDGRNWLSRFVDGSQN